MSDSEVPRRNATDGGRDGGELPVMPVRWDAPPSSLSEEELLRMAPGRCGDELLTAVSDALCEPVAWKDSPSSRAERLKRITEKGERLRQQWAETAALEEAYAAPSPTLQERQRAARAYKEAMLLDGLRRHRRRMRLQLIALALYALGTLGAFVAALLGYINTDTFSETFIVIAHSSAIAMVAYRGGNGIRVRFQSVGCRRGDRGSESTNSKGETMTTPE